jgi:hypothetical protein
LKSPFEFQPAGQSGMALSELLPRTAGIADEITLIRSMKTDSVDHESALRIIHSGKFQAGRPTWGSWVIYGLGTERQDLPAYVVLSDPGGLPVDGIRNWTSAGCRLFIKARRFASEGTPVFNLEPLADVPAPARANQRRFARRPQPLPSAAHPGNSELTARIRNFEIAARMQTSVTECSTSPRSPEHVRKLYGLDHSNKTTANYARRCLMARRLVEQGVRFVQIFLNGQPWDTHDKNAEKLRGLCEMTDQPSAAPRA